MPIADRNEQLQPGVPPSAPQFRHIVDALMSQPMARPRLGTGQQPPWGFHEPTVQAGAGVDAAVQAAPQVLSDPRNAWFGLGPIAGMARPIQGMGGWMRGWDRLQDAGGFKPPASHLPDMGQLQQLNHLAGQPDNEIGIRHLRMLNPIPPFVQDIDEIRKAQHTLKGERDMASYGGGANGGSIPPRSLMEDLKEKYGFGE